MEAIYEFLDYARKEFGLEFPDNIDVSGKQKRYKMKGDKGASKSGFVTFYLDSNPMAVFGCWKTHGEATFKWYFRNQNELSTKERKEHAKIMRERQEAGRIADAKRKHAAAVKAGELWSLPDIGGMNFPYLSNKKCGDYGVKFYDNQTAFEYFASDERKEKLANGEIEVYPGSIMVVPVQNAAGQLVSLQQISSNGKFKGFLPNGSKKGCFHVIHGDDSIVFVAEGYATAATIHELTGCTVYVSFDCGNLMDVSLTVSIKHPQSVKIVASDNDRFTLAPINNPGQKKAIEICSKLGFYNLKPDFHDGQEGTDWNDLLLYYPFETVKNYAMKKLQVLFDTYDL